MSITPDPDSQTSPTDQITSANLQRQVVPLRILTIILGIVIVGLGLIIRQLVFDNSKCNDLANLPLPSPSPSPLPNNIIIPSAEPGIQSALPITTDLATALDTYCQGDDIYSETIALSQLPIKVSSTFPTLFPDQTLNCEGSNEDPNQSFKELDFFNPGTRHAYFGNELAAVYLTTPTSSMIPRMSHITDEYIFRFPQTSSSSSELVLEYHNPYPYSKVLPQIFYLIGRKRDSQGSAAVTAIASGSVPTQTGALKPIYDQYCEEEDAVGTQIRPCDPSIKDFDAKITEVILTLPQYQEAQVRVQQILDSIII